MNTAPCRRAGESIATKGVTTAAVAFAAGVISAGPARADDPEAGSNCLAADLNKTATTSAGTAVRCLANEQGSFSWMVDRGAVGTIGDLQNQRYTVNIDRVGSGPLDQCTVTSVRNPNTATRAVRSAPARSTPSSSARRSRSHSTARGRRSSRARSGYGGAFSRPRVGQLPVWTWMRFSVGPGFGTPTDTVRMPLS